MIILLIVSTGTLFTAAPLTFPSVLGVFKKKKEKGKKKACGFIFNDCAVCVSVRVRACVFAKEYECALMCEWARGVCVYT